MNRKTASPLPSTTADERWEFIRTAIDAAGVDPVDVAMAALDTIALLEEEPTFVAGLIGLLTAARGNASVRRGDPPCSCASCTASRGDGPSPAAVYYIPSVLGDES